jgi:hypothetical protein
MKIMTVAYISGETNNNELSDSPHNKRNCSFLIDEMCINIDIPCTEK